MCALIDFFFLKLQFSICFSVLDLSFTILFVVEGERHVPGGHLPEPLPARVPLPPAQPPVHASPSPPVLSGHLAGPLPADPVRHVGRHRRQRPLPLRPPDPLLLLQQGRARLPQGPGRPLLRLPHAADRLLERGHLSLVEDEEDELDQPVPAGGGGARGADDSSR